MSKYNEFKAWNVMPKGEVRVDAPDGVVSLDGTDIRSTMYDTTAHPVLQSGDWQMPHQRYEKTNERVKNNENGK